MGPHEIRSSSPACVAGVHPDAERYLVLSLMVNAVPAAHCRTEFARKMGIIEGRAPSLESPRTPEFVDFRETLGIVRGPLVGWVPILVPRMFEASEEHQPS